MTPNDILVLSFTIIGAWLPLYLTYKLGRFKGEEAMADEMARLRQSRYQDGYRVGYERGQAEGYNKGYTKGRAEGYDDGRRYEAITHHNEEEIKRQLKQ